jgi:hypothetical protein
MGGPQPISMGDIMAYCAMGAIAEPSDRMLLLRLVQAMDAEFMKYVVEQQKRRDKK